MRVLPTKARLAAWLLPLGLGSAMALAQDENPFDRSPQDCVTVSSIDETKAVDDQNIIFRMRGDRVFRNHLPRKCPGLERENRFMYETRGGRLCSIDTITVLEQFGLGLQRGFTCRLGEFVPLSPDEVEDLEYREEQGGAQNNVRPEPLARRRERSQSATSEAPPPPEPEPSKPEPVEAAAER